MIGIVDFVVCDYHTKLQCCAHHQRWQLARHSSHCRLSSWAYADNKQSYMVRQPKRCAGVCPLVCTSNFSESYVRVGQVVRTSARSPPGGVWLTSEAKALPLTLNPTPQSMLLRYIITCMLHVCYAIDRISCYFDSMVEIMAERRFRVNLSVQIICLHAPNYMIWQ